METFSSQWWEIDLPDGWEAEPEEHCVTISDPNGVGALQVGAYQKPDGIVNEDNLLDATELEPLSRKNLEKKRYKDFEGFHYTFSADDRFWRKWWLRSGYTMMFVTYNCAFAARDVESEIIDKMVSSLKNRQK